VIGAVLADAAASDAGTSAAAVERGRGGAETDAAAAVGVRGGGAVIGAVLADAAASDAGTSAAVECGRGGAEMGAVLAGAARSNAGTIGLRKSLGGKNILSPAPTAKEKTMVRAAPNGVLTASTKVLAQSDFLLSGRTRTIALSPFFRAPISPPSLIFETESLVVSRNQQKVRSSDRTKLASATYRLCVQNADTAAIHDGHIFATKCRMSALAGSIDASRSAQSLSVSSVHHARQSAPGADCRIA